MLVLRVTSWESKGVLPMPQQKNLWFFLWAFGSMGASHKQAALPQKRAQESFHRNASADHLRPSIFNLQMKGFLNVF